jgi:hypothetical protein
MKYTFFLLLVIKPVPHVTCGEVTSRVIYLEKRSPCMYQGRPAKCRKSKQKVTSLSPDENSLAWELVKEYRFHTY